MHIPVTRHLRFHLAIEFIRVHERHIQTPPPRGVSDLTLLFQERDEVSLLVVRAGQPSRCRRWLSRAARG